MITNEEKLELHDRLLVARDIVINIKDDMKIMASRTPVNKEYYFLAMRAAETALEINKLMADALEVEKSYKAFLERKGGK